MSMYVLCEGCLRVLDYSDDRSDGAELCVCGSNFCGCTGCSEMVNQLLVGVIPSGLMLTDITGWTPQGGALSYD